jgi:drug/metabolite transporter (DMT)-like permease
MNDDKKEKLLWWVMMLVLVCLVIIFQYKDTPHWTDAIEPVLAIGVLVLLSGAIFEFYFAVVGRYRPNIWSFVGLGASIACLLFLWFLGSPVKGLVAIVGMTLGFTIVVLLANWIKGRM